MHSNFGKQVFLRVFSYQVHLSICRHVQST